MQILLTGATGFIGKHVLNELEARNGLDIKIICRDKDAIKASAAHVFLHDIFEIPSVKLYEELGFPEVVIHLAWSHLDDYENKIHEHQILPAHKRFLGALLKQGLRDLTVIGTCQEYGMQEGCLSEDVAPKPNTSYARAKNQLRQEVSKLACEVNSEFKWVRLFYTYGQGQSQKSLFAQLDKAIENRSSVFNMSPGDQLRDYLPVETLARFIVDIALQKEVSGIINCCSGVPVSVT